MRNYMTKQGDTWDMIAHKCYEDGEMWMSTLITINSDYADIVEFPAGIYLIIPDKNYNNPDYVPPWRR